jgi:2-polyprenyl-6-hydroxyphenyl methylase / 3-demethylubiquinone-9 3-methyltransferase
MPVDNQIYDRLAETWWDEDAIPALLRAGINPSRFGYMHRALTAEVGPDLDTKRCLDVGCGGGLLAEQFASLGCRVTGVDPSAPSLQTAEAHAAREGLVIQYLQAWGEDLPFDADSFDIVYCCDVLEHVNSVDRTVAEAARVLKPGGVYLYDTINRTARSRFVMIKLMQDWDATRCMEPGVHDWNMFIRPDELEQSLRRHGLASRGVVGLAPGINLIAFVRALRRRRRGDTTYAELGRQLKMRESRDTSISYAGHAVAAANLS